MNASRPNGPRPHGGRALAAIALSHDGATLHLAHALDVDDAGMLLSSPGRVAVSTWDRASERRLGHWQSPPVACPRLVALGPMGVLLVHQDGALALDTTVGSARAIAEVRRDHLGVSPVADRAGRTLLASVKRGDRPVLLRTSVETGQQALVDEARADLFGLSPSGRWIAIAARDAARWSELHLRVIDSSSRSGEIVHQSRVTASGAPLDGAMIIDDSGRVVAWTGDQTLWVQRVGADTFSVPTSSLRHAALAFGRHDHLGRPTALRAVGCDPLALSLSVDLERATKDRYEYVGPLRAWALSGDGRFEVHGSDSGVVVHVREQANAIVGGSAIEGGSGGAPVSRARGGDVSAVAFLDAIEQVITATKAHGGLTLWSPSGERLGVLDTGAKGIHALHACDDGASLVYVGIDGALGVCRPREGAIQRWPTPFVYASELALEPGARRAFVVHGLVDGLRGKSYGNNLPREKQDVSTVWDVERGALLATLDHIPQLAQSAAWLHDGSGRICLRRGLAVHLVALPAGAAGYTTSFPAGVSPFGAPPAGVSVLELPSPRLAPGGLDVLTAVGTDLVVYDLRTASVRATLCDARGAKILAMDARAERCVLASRDRGAALHSLLDGRVIAALTPEHGGDRVAFAAFGPRTGGVAFVTEGGALQTKWA